MPTFFDNNRIEYSDTVEVEMCDFTQFGPFDRIRAIYYRLANVILVMYACDDIQSFDDIVFKYLPEIENDARENVPIIVCATKHDLKEQDPSKTYVPISKAYALMKKHRNIVGIIENSAFTGYHIHATLDMCVQSTARSIPIEPFSGLLPFKEGELVHAYYKNKSHKA